MKGSARKPLAMQKGHLNVAVVQQRQAEEELVRTANDQILRPPAWMKNKVARKEWKRVVPQLLEIDVVGNLDMANIAGYCMAFANYRKATEELENNPLVCVDEENGTAAVSPYINIQAKYAQEMRRFADLCGMSVGSRLKAAAAKTKEKESEMESIFGVI